jgi:hypothetical protein
MISLGDPGTFWLNLTNVGLGVVTLVCCVVVGRAMFQDLTAHMRQRSADRADVKLELFSHPQVGLTMADGGEPVKKDSKK